MNNRIVAALIGCVLISALGGFGAPLLCRGSADSKCAEHWQTAAGGALTASATLSALLARITGTDQPPKP